MDKGRLALGVVLVTLVAESIEILRQYRGHIAVVTQTNTRRSLSPASVPL